MKKLIVTATLFALLISNTLTAQVAINADGTTPDTSAVLDVKSTTKGFLPPRMTVAQRDAINTPHSGLIIYNTSTKRPNYYSGTQWETFDGTWKSCGGTFTYSGQDYNTVMIGNQCWMAENLNYPTTNSWCYNNSGANCNIYGRLYTWEAALTACPSGWHLPSDDDWKIMEIALGMSQSEADNFGWRGTNEGEKMKSTSGWYNNGNGTNSSGFNALPGGFQQINMSYDLGYSGTWWSSTLYSGLYARDRQLNYNYDQVHRTNDMTGFGFSVRCLKN